MAETTMAVWWSWSTSSVMSGFGGCSGRLFWQAIQDLIDVELTASIGAEPHERTETKTNRVTGPGPRVLSTQRGMWSYAGGVDLGVRQSIVAV